MEGVEVSKRMSNLAFNQEFPAASGLSGIPRKNQVRIAHDRQNPYDVDAVGIWLEGFPTVPLGWLYRKEALRQIEWVGGRMLWSGRALNWS
jgi:hypothetical protein